MGVLLLLLLFWAPQQALCAGSSKVACDYSNRLCQWNATYGLGAAVLGDLAFFHGGLYANDATTPVNGSFLEAMDLRTMSPLVIQVDFNPLLNSTRYKHHLVTWNGLVLAVGGFVDDSNGKSRTVLNVIALDLNTRSWISLKNFTTQGVSAQSDYVFNAAAISGDFLLVAFQIMDPKAPSRNYLALDLNTAKVDATYTLDTSVLMLDWPLIAIMSLTNDGRKPDLVLQAKRQIPAATNDYMNWFVIDEAKTSGPLPWRASTTLPKRPGGVGGKVLALNIIKIGGKPKLVLLAATTALFRGSAQPQNVTTVTVHDLSVKGVSSVALQLSNVMLTPPLGLQLADVRSADLPLFGSVGLSAADATLLPYVGRVDLISTLDPSNGNIQQAPGGFIIRGSGIADQSCQQGATWQPFVIKASFARAGPPNVVAVSNYTWCPTRAQQVTAAAIINDASQLATNTKMFKVDSKTGTQLLILNAQSQTVAGGQFTVFNEKAPLMGAFINLNRSSVQNFTIKPAKSYKFPKGVSSCVTPLAGQPVYVEMGGTAFATGDGKGHDEMAKGVHVMDTATTAGQHTLLAAAGGDAVPDRTQAALACSPDGRLFLFGGLVEGGQTVTNGNEGQVTTTLWKPTNSLYSFKLSGSAAAPRITKQSEVTKATPQPSARSGHSLVYLAPDVVAGLGMKQGAVMLYGGSDVPYNSFEDFTSSDNETESAAKLAPTTWDTSAWLFDLGSSKWVKLATTGASPPGLMYHSMEASGKQVVVFGGQAFNPSSSQVRISTMLYVLDFSSNPPRWRQALIQLNNQGAYQFGYPSTGVVMLPEFGAVALKHISAVNLAPIPQSLEITGGKDIMARWGLNTLNTTAGDWVRLAPTQQPLVLQQPLLVASDVIISGVPPGKPAGRHLLQQGGKLALACRNDTEMGTGVRVRSNGAQLSGFDISGCIKAVDIQVDATGAYKTPAVLSNVTIHDNEGPVGSAIFIGPAAVATLQSVTIFGNTAGLGNVFAAERSALALLNCSVFDNSGTAITFAGSNLTVRNTSFANNAAAPPGVLQPEGERSMNAGGALRLLCLDSGPGGYASVAQISDSSFNNNRGLNGGAVYAGRGTILTLQRVVFTNNSGYDGGAVFADRDSCVDNMINTTFKRNSAAERGGAVKMHNPSCRDVSWSGGIFSNNTAADGGALYLTEVTTRNVNASAVYEHNTATRPFTTVGPTSVPGGAGGAIFMGLWGTNVLLFDSTFTNNGASQLGGAIHTLAIDSSSLELRNVTATGNVANQGAAALNDDGFIASTLRSEGGALHVSGNEAAVKITDSTLSYNLAGRGGAVSVNSARGAVAVSNSTFTSNEAWTAGGAVSVTERKTVEVTDTSFSHNRLWWRELAAGGGLYCFLCSSVTMDSCSFTGNRAAYGGGAAVLQPWQRAVITNTSFVENVALPDPSGELPDPATNKRRRSLLAVGSFSGFSGSVAVNPQRVGGAAAAAAILGPLGANVTGDNGYYTGGGGLYVSVSSAVSLQECAFLANSAYNGGGLLARTDACKPARSTTTGSTCGLQLSSVSVRDNKAWAAGGALITNISPEVVQMDGCKQGPSLDRSSLSCLEAPNALIKQVSSSRAGRSLLQSGANGPNAAVSGYGNTVLTSTAKVKCQNLIRTSGDQEWWNEENCTNPIRAPPGQPFGKAFRMLDGFDDPIKSGIYDANMPMSALADVKGVPFRIFGNTTQAQNGLAKFTGLTVNGKPGDTVRLTFRTQNGLTLTREVVLRKCEAGEYTDNSTSTPNELSFSCRPCPSPQYSFYPTATSCSQCASLPVNSYTVCNLAALVPADGYYQSHPRSPVLTRCISSLACRRGDQISYEMANWAYSHSHLSTLNMTDASITLYMEHMCAPGFTGPLCGACQEGHGHSGLRCVKCPEASVNSLLYFLVCCFMLLIPVVQMILHNKNVDKNTQLVQAASKMAVPWGVTPSFQGRTSNTSAGALYTPGLPPLEERSSLPSQSPTAETTGDVREYPSPGKDAMSLEMAHMQHTAPLESAVKPDLAAMSRDQSSLASFEMMSPFSEPSAIAGAMAISRDNSASSALTLPSLGGTQQLQALGPTASSNKSATLFQRLFDHNSLDHEDYYTWGTQHISIKRRVFGRNPISMVRRGPSGASTSSMSSIASRGPSAAAAAAAEPAGVEQPGGPGAAGEAAGGLGTAAGGTIPAGAVAMMTPRGAIHRRTYKFWHSDIISMLVNYVQLLGLLRLVRINWAEQLDLMLTYMDLTSGATTWMSVECSMTESGGVPRSVKRSVVVLLFPVAALAAVVCFWLVAAIVLRTKAWARRPVFFRRWLKTHIVMSVVILLYFLYTTTTREIISLFSCQQVDDPNRLPRTAWGGLDSRDENPYYSEAMGALRYVTPSWMQGFWTSDTRVRCGSSAHLGLVIGLGIPGVIFFALGLPLGLSVLLWRIHREQGADGRTRLEDPEVELQFGSVYDKYRYSCYYWECVVLLEAFLLALTLVMLQTQNNAALQVLVAMAIIFVEAVLHITFQPYACRLLDTLRRLAVFALMATLFLLMLVTLSETQQYTQLVVACMVIVALINAGVIGVHLWATGREVKRWLLWLAGKGPDDKLELRDLKMALPDSVRGQRWLQCGGCLTGGAANQPKAAGGGRSGTGGAPSAAGGPPVESVDGAAASDQRKGQPPTEHAGPVEEVPSRPGVVVVVNPAAPGTAGATAEAAPAAPRGQPAAAQAASAQATPGWLWRRRKSGQ